MSTDFTKNSVSIMGGIFPTSTNTPGDIRCRVETEADIYTIPNPYVGMEVYVLDTGKKFEVLTLKSKISGIAVIPNALVDTYRDVTVDLTKLVTKDDLHEHINLELLSNIKETDIANWNAKVDIEEVPINLSDLINDVPFASEEFVLRKIAEAELSDKEVDLSAYAKLSDLDDYAKNIDLASYVLTEDLEASYATIEYVNAKIDMHDHEVISEEEIDDCINQ